MSTDAERLRECPEMETLIAELCLKRDALYIYHSWMKKRNDMYNKAIITISLLNGMIESIKMQMGYKAAVWMLMPILISSLIAIISALVKFEDFPGRMEAVVKSAGIITAALSKFRVCRNAIATHEEVRTYSEALENIETGMRPDDRRRFVRDSYTLLSSMKEDVASFKRKAAKKNAVAETKAAKLRAVTKAAVAMQAVPKSVPPAKRRMPAAKGSDDSEEERPPPIMLQQPADGLLAPSSVTMSSDTSDP